MLEDKQANRQLLQKYRELQKQLKQAYLQIKSLQDENQNLKQRLSRYENQQSTYCLNSQGSEQEVFTSSSQSESDQQEYINFNQQAQQILQPQNNKANSGSESQIMMPVSVSRKLEKTPTKVIFNYLSEGSQVPKLLTKQSKKQNVRSHTQVPQNNTNKWGGLSIEHSAIKTEQPILSKNLTNTIFQRVRNSNKIFDAFFVTGYNFGSQGPVIDYTFPSMSKHIPAILSLIYTENSLRPLENVPSCKSPRNFRPGKLSIKDSFVMILCKGQNGQKQYLFACQVDDILEGPDRNLYVFNRLFCFVSSCNFFSAFLKIIDQFIGKINNTKQDLRLLSPLYQHGTKDQLRDLLEQHLKFLFQKNVQQNQTLNLRLDKQINIFIDVPSSLESYRTLLDYRPWGILFCPVYLPNEQEQKQIKQKQLFGFLLVYLLTETKIMLYSMVKSKVSQAIIHALEMIKPLEYVNPIIMATIKDEHQEYFNAPMSVIMGLWGEQKLKRKQKIEIFMNKKPSFCNISGILEQNKMGNVDGVVFNLDTGYTFGGGLSTQKNKLAIQLNSLIQNTRNKTKQQYKIIQQLLSCRSGYENPFSQTKQLSQKLISAINGTQLYSFYKDKNSYLFKN